MAELNGVSWYEGNNRAAEHVTTPGGIRRRQVAKPLEEARQERVSSSAAYSSPDSFAAAIISSHGHWTVEKRR